MDQEKEKPGWQAGQRETNEPDKVTKLNPIFNDEILDLNNPDTFKNEFVEIQTRLNGSENKFPVEVFPGLIQSVINETNECLKYPVDFIGASMLFAASTVIGNTYKAEIIPGWVEGVTLYLALVGRAGTNKSHPLNFALQPIFENDKTTFATYKQALAAYKRALFHSKSDGTEPPEKPYWKRYIVSDFTPESLSEIHRHNIRGVGVYSDELAGWFKNFNRYHKGNETEFWLSNFSGKPTVIDRKNQEPIVIPTPAISVCGSIQPGVLLELQKENKGENGFVDRILFGFPENLQKQYWSEKSLSPAIVDSWAQIVSNLFSVPMNIDETDNPQPQVLRFSPGALKLLKEWQRENTDLSNYPENEVFAGIYSKLEIYVIRLSLIMELLFWATGENANNLISDKAAKSAIALIEYFRKTAQKVNGIIAKTNPIETLTMDKRRVFDSLPNEFTTEGGLIIANQTGMNERTFERFLTDERYFERIKHGQYTKKQNLL